MCEPVLCLTFNLFEHRTGAHMQGNKPMTWKMNNKYKREDVTQNY